MGATDLKRHELIALCAAALRPTKRMWQRFTDELRALKESGRVTSDEEVALLTTHFVDTKLAEVEDEDDVDAETVVDVIQRFHESIEAEVDRKLGEAVEAKGAELGVELAAAKATALEREETERAAVERAARSEEAKREIEIRVIGRVRRIAGWIGACTYWGAAVIIAAATLVGAGLLSTSTFWPRILAGSVVVMAAILNFVNLQTGLSVRHLRRQVEARVIPVITRWWLGRES